MFFIFGSPRSGTTLLAQCLGAHADVIVPDETDFIIPRAFVADRVTDPEERRAILRHLIPHTRRFDRSIGEFLSRAEVIEIIDEHGADPARLIREIYAAVAGKAGKAVAGDKSPNDILFLRMLVKTGMLNSALPIIHIVRDGRDVLSSLVAAGMTDDPETWFPLVWNSSNLYLHLVFGGSAQYMLVRYEDFVHSPEPEWRRICAHLGIAFSSSMLDPERRHARYRGDAAHSKLYDVISSRNIGDHRAALPEAAIARCELDAGLALQTFGYLTPVATSFRQGAVYVSNP